MIIKNTLEIKVSKGNELLHFKTPALPTLLRTWRISNVKQLLDDTIPWFRWKKSDEWMTWNNYFFLTVRKSI